MNDKYYTPSIEEFHVGFEYESTTSPTKEDWYKAVINNVDDLYDVFSYSNARVKHLDREDIESLGWAVGRLPWQYFDGIHNLVYLKNNKYSINHIADEVCLFYGTIKNKSELKVLLKQLGI